MTWQDWKLAMRSLRRAPGFSLAILLTLTIAIGLATSVFSVVNAVLLRPLPYADSGRLAMIWSASANESHGPVSFDDFEDWVRDSRTIERAGVFSSYYHPVLTGSGAARRLSGLLVSHGYFDVMGVQPAMGRFFQPAEDRDGPDNVVVLSWALWQSQFHGDPHAVGRTVLLNAVPHTIVGVAGRNLPPLPLSLASEPPEFYRPVGVEYGPGSRDGRYLRLIARLRPGADLQQAQAELNVRSRSMEQAHPDADAHLKADIVSLRDELVRPVQAGLLAVEGAVLVFLMIACANIANLLLARWSVRRRQMAIRAALGARQFRLAGTLLTESLLLGGIGGCAGILTAWWGTAAFTMVAARVLPNAGTISLDLRVLVFAIAITLAATILFGAAPLLQLRTAFPEEALRSGRRTSGDGRQGLRQILAAAQIAMALALLISAGLLGRSFSRLRSYHPGFEPAGVLTAALSAPQAHYKNDAASAAFLRRVLENIRSMPGVREASAVSVVPLSPDFDRTGLVIPGKTPDSLRQMNPDRYIVAPGYFQAMRIPLREGRWIDERDDESHPPVCVVSETAARLWFPGERALGKTVRAGGTAGFDDSPMRTIVGVVADVSQYGLGLPSTPQIYMPHAQFARRGMTLLVRTTGDPEALGPALQKVVLAVDSEVPLYNVDSLEHVVSNTIATRRVGTWLLAIFAAGALLLAAIGIYGVVAFAVEQRTAEFGIRMALGATDNDVLRHVFASAWPVMVGGLAGGIAVSMAASRVISGFLVGVSPTDAGTYAVLSIGVGAVVCAACYRPARRAARIDPLVALRYE